MPLSDPLPAWPPVIARWCAAALLVHPDGRYLMQLRDDKPNILLPAHWGLFGGTIDPGEDPAAAIVRELEEELEFRPRDVVYFTELVVRLPTRGPIASLNVSNAAAVALYELARRAPSPVAPS